MPEFRFRAAAALDLRARQEQAALLVKARAEAALAEARGFFDRVASERRNAQSTLESQQRHGLDVATLLWHRNWISRLGGAVDRLAVDVDRRASLVRDAERAWHEARRKRLALERLRERAWRRYQRDQAREEMKVIEELARLRYALRDDVEDHQ